MPTTSLNAVEQPHGCSTAIEQVSDESDSDSTAQSVDVGKKQFKKNGSHVILI